jgi:NADH:ubiquinone oxidoreductase subunit 3 (subunit A)
MKEKAQTTLEFALCLIVLILLFIAAFKVFIWAGNDMVKQQQAYDSGRVSAGTTGAQFYNADNIDLVPKINP